MINNNLSAIKRFHASGKVSTNLPAGNIYRSYGINIDISSLNLSSVSHVQVTGVMKNIDFVWCSVYNVTTTNVGVCFETYSSYTDMPYDVYIEIIE